MHLRALAVSAVFASALATTGCSCGGAGEAPDSPDAGAIVDARAPIGDGARAPDAEVSPRSLVLVFGDDVVPAVRERVEALLRDLAAKSALPVAIAAASEIPRGLGAGSVVLAFGDTAATRTLISPADLAASGSEGFVVRKGALDGASLLAATGNGLAPDPFGHGNLGAAFAAYALLEELGFAFLHPLAPTLPRALAIPEGPLDRREKPYWRARAIHLHTQHPLELTEMLQGFGPGGPDDEAGFRALLPEWDRYLEWLIANRQNRVEWFLLAADSWKAFSTSATRQARLGTLVEMAHRHGVAVGLDVPIAFAQQHAFRLLTTTGNLDDEKREIRSAVDWVMATKLDFLGTEAGTSEFTHPAPERMLAWLDELAKHLDDAYEKRAYVKVHCSTGQTAAGYPDPSTGQPINFNMLPHFANPKMGVLPHTVQHYSLEDSAPTYGNQNFAYMREFLQREVGTREVLYYPEAAYWVGFDVDVPLFLPIYAERRLRDLRLLAGDELAGRMGRGAHAGERMDGQLLFSSGWEWGYWLNDVVAARAAWDPQIDAPTPRDAFVRALAPVVRPMGPAAAEVAALVADYAEAEDALLIGGKVAGVPPKGIAQRNGQAYLQGFDTWSDVSKLAAGLNVSGGQMTQPDRLGLVDMRNPLRGGVGYSAEVEPLLAEMEVTFAGLADRATALRAKVPDEARDLFDDLHDAAKMTALRAQQIHGLYDYVDGFLSAPDGARRARLGSARRALDAALVVAKGRETHYRVPADRIAGWRQNPTAYEFGYLWKVRSLFYWWRDEGKAVDAPVSPCYLNIINPVDVGFGEGLGVDAVRVLGGVLGSGDQRGCLAEPKAEPRYPQDDLPRAAINASCSRS